MGAALRGWDRLVALDRNALAAVRTRTGAETIVGKIVSRKSVVSGAKADLRSGAGAIAARSGRFV